jgi:hypothetical protein
MRFRHCSNKYKCNTITTPSYVILTVRPPYKLYTHLSQALLFRLICHTPIKNRGLDVDPRPFPTVLTMKNIKKYHLSHVPFMLLDIIIARWRRPVASSKALDLLHQAIHAVTYRRIATAIKLASFVGVFVDCCLFACCPGGCWGNTEQVVTRCRHPVASRVALDMLHWAMRFVSHRRTAMAIKMANNGGTC